MWEELRLGAGRGFAQGLLAEGLWPGEPVLLCCQQSWPAESSSGAFWPSVPSWHRAQSPGTSLWLLPWLQFPTMSAFLPHVCISISAKVSVWFGFSIGFSLRHRFSYHRQSLIPHRLSQAPWWEQVRSRYLLLPAKPVAANTERKMELDLNLPKAHGGKMCYQDAPGMCSCCFSRVLLLGGDLVILSCSDRTLNLVIFF